MEDIQKLKTLITQLHTLPEEDWIAFSSIWSPFSAKRKEMLTTAGEQEKYLYFVLEGVQRVYYSDNQEREATLVFTYAPSFGGVLDSLMMQSPSRYYYETLTASEFLRAPFTRLEQTMKRPAVETLIRKGITGALAGVLERLAELQAFSAEEKFRSLMKRSPHVLTLIPHKYLANYIGIDASNFSKFINTITI